jgi:diguanylate cyclase (GGDEF)-like protein
MVDREQEQARLLAEAMGANGRAGRDLGWIVALTIALAGLSIATGSVSRVLGWASELSDANLDGVVALVMLVPIGAVIYAVRRYRDAEHARVRLHDLSQRDSLTGLPNRRFLGEGFDAMLRSARRINGRLGVLFIDLDGFKKVNDTWGHEVGDQLMVAVADRLTNVLSPEDRVVRYGGDEFIAFCPEVTNALSAERIATRVVRAIETPFEFGDDHLRISASVGVAVTEERCDRPDEVLHDADIAMYEAKSAGSGQVAVYDRSMRGHLTPSSAERRLRQALDAGELRLFYQPIVSLRTRHLVGVEARLRWKDPDRGIVELDELWPTIEDSGLIVPVGNWVLGEVCAQSRRWQEAHPERPPLNIKVSVAARQLAQTTFAANLRHHLETTGADPAHLSLEITEGALAHDLQSAWSTLREVKALGVGLALDELGTGYSSLSYLRRFNLDLLRIDRSFVEGLGQSDEDAIIVTHLVAMARALGIVTVAAGVTTPDQAERLRALRCDLAQGDLFAGALPPALVDQVLAGGPGQVWRAPRPHRAEDAEIEAPSVVITTSATASTPTGAGTRRR